MSVKMRQEVECKIAKAFVKAAIKDEYAITVDYGDGPSNYLGSTKAVLAAMFQGDEDHQFIYGNDGWDVISDYSVNLEYLMGPANVISKQYED